MRIVAGTASPGKEAWSEMGPSTILIPAGEVVGATPFSIAGGW